MTRITADDRGFAMKQSRAQELREMAPSKIKACRKACDMSQRHGKEEDEMWKTSFHIRYPQHFTHINN